jgi:formimidoylglutamate deiminase
MPQRLLVEADLTWTDSAFERGLQVLIEPDGRVGSVGAGLGRPDVALAGRALLPGMVNAHSHAFQRGLRGLGERYSRGPGSFWTWREGMYGLACSMDEQTMYDLSRQAYREMLEAGITAVGEFHYLHHGATGRGFALDEPVLRAAAEAGIRIVLLECLYRGGGVGGPLQEAQRRFSCTPGELWAQLDRLAAMLDWHTQALGVAAHSIRAVAPDEIADLHAEAARRGMVFHMHVEEQRREIEDCVAALGEPPMAVLNRGLRVDGRFTAVHCTHTAPADADAFGAAGGNACICPLTEAALGDGIPDLRRLRSAGASICLGTDSNGRIDLVEEMRWLEYAQRLKLEQRGVLTDEDGRSAAALLRAATLGGARSLGLCSGRIAPGHDADFLTLDLSAPCLGGWTDQTLLESFVFGGGEEAIAGVCVGGSWRERQDRT